MCKSILYLCFNIKSDLAIIFFFTTTALTRHILHVDISEVDSALSSGMIIINKKLLASTFNML